MKTLIIAPVHKQPSKEWVEALKGEDVLIIDDSKNNGNKVELPFKMIPNTLFPKDAACKSLGLLKAYKRGYDTAIVLDSDCIIPEGFTKKHLEILKKRGHGWTNPLIDWFPRGYPYSQRSKKIIANVGLWTNILDINGKDRIEVNSPDNPGWIGTRIAENKIPLCGMNLAVKTEAIPALLFLPKFDYKGLKFRRYDDIYGGYIFEKIVEKMGDVISYGEPYIYHEGELDPEADALEEKDFILMEDTFYKLVDKAMEGIDGTTYKEIFGKFADKSIIFKNTIFEPLIKPICLWKNLIS